MIDAIIKFSLRQRATVLFLVALLLIAGIYSLSRLPIDAIPDITNTQVQIITSAPALAPLEVERQITYPVETAMSGLPGLAEIRSLSKFGLSVVTVVFDDGVDIYFARSLVLEKLSGVRQQIPEGIGVPQMGPISTGLGEIYQFEIVAAKGFQFSIQDLRTVLDWYIRRQLLGVGGVAEVNGYGGLEKQFQVRLDPVRMQAYNLTLREIVDSITRNNGNVGGAYIEHAGEQYLLRGVGLLTSCQEINNIVLKTGKDGLPILVKDVGDVVQGSAVRQGAVTADGKGETVAAIAMMLKGENSRTTVEGIKKRLQELRAELPAGMELRTFYDRAELIDRTIDTVKHNLMEGAVLVSLVLILLLGNWRAAFLVASVIPLAMFFASICMMICHVPANLMSLGAIDFGLIVDGAVVMVENAIRSLSEAHKKQAATDNTKIILDSCLEVGRPVVFAVTIITIVYLPLLTLIGTEGKMFKPMAETVVFALLGSLLLSLTYIPAMLTILFRNQVISERTNFFDKLKEQYTYALAAVQKYRNMAFASALAMVVVSLLIIPSLGAEFIPRLDEGAFAIQIQQLPSVSLSEAIATTTRAELILKKFPQVNRVISKIGRAEVATDPMGVDTVDVLVTFKSGIDHAASDREKLIASMSEALEQGIPNAVFSFSQPIELRASELISGVKSDIAIKIFGEDFKILKDMAERISKIVAKIKGANDIKVEQVSGLPQLTITADRAKIARYGINIEDVNNLVECIVAGKIAGVVYEGDRKFDLTVRLKDGLIHDPESVKKLMVSSPSGALIPLAQLADIKIITGASQISRENRERRIAVELNVRGRDISSFVSEAEEKIRQVLKLPEGYHITWGGQFESLQEAIQRLSVVVPLALFSILFLLFTSFHSWRLALVVFSGVPFAIVGGVLALAVRGLPFSISAAVGFIALFGVAVLNGVVLVSYINTLRATEMSLPNAVLKGAATRLRPVLMTALVASLGFLPMALSTSAGAEVQRPLATVVIGGLITSTILTLFILPSLYMFVWERGSSAS